MKQSILILTAAILSFTSGNAQFWKNETIKGNGEMTAENRSTGDYDNIFLLGQMDVELIAGTEGNITVEAESNLLEHIVTEVKNGSLKISPREKSNLEPSKDHSIKIIVPFTELNGVKVTGSGDLWNEDVIKGNYFRTALTGSGDIKLHLEVENLEGQITGSGDTNLHGSAEKIECKVTGSGNFNAFDLKSLDVKATIMGSGDIFINASGSLEAKVMGSGSIKYRGNPEKEDFKAMGSGSISSK